MLEFGDRWQRIGGASQFAAFFENRPFCEQAPLPEPDLPALQDVLARYDAHIGVPLGLNRGWLRPDELDLLGARVAKALSAVCGEYNLERAAELTASAERSEDLLSTPCKLILSPCWRRLQPGAVPYDSEFLVAVKRAWVNCFEKPWRVEALLSCCCAYQEEEAYLFFDSERQHYALKAPVLNAVSGDLTQVLYGEGFRHHPVFSAAAYGELMRMAAGDFNDLPHTLLRQIKWRMLLTSGASSVDHVHLSSFNQPVDEKQGTFLVDTHPLGLFTVRLALDWRGQVTSEVKPKPCRRLSIDE